MEIKVIEDEWPSEIGMQELPYSDQITYTEIIIWTYNLSSRF